MLAAAADVLALLTKPPNTLMPRNPIFSQMTLAQRRENLNEQEQSSEARHTPKRNRQFQVKACSSC